MDILKMGPPAAKISGSRRKGKSRGQKNTRYTSKTSVAPVPSPKASSQFPTNSDQSGSIQETASDIQCNIAPSLMPEKDSSVVMADEPCNSQVLEALDGNSMSVPSSQLSTEDWTSGSHLTPSIQDAEHEMPISGSLLCENDWEFVEAKDDPSEDADGDFVVVS